MFRFHLVKFLSADMNRATSVLTSPPSFAGLLQFVRLRCGPLWLKERVTKRFSCCVCSSSDIRGWDVFRTAPHALEGTQRHSACIDVCLQILKSVVHVITFLLVLITAVVSKSAVLFMTSQLEPEKKVSSCKKTG